MSETLGQIDLRNEDFAEGLGRLGFTGYKVLESEERMLGTVHEHALRVHGNPQFCVWGVRGEHSPYHDGALDGDKLYVDAVSGGVRQFPVLPPGNMGDFQLEREAFLSQWSRISDLDVRITTAPIIDNCIALAGILRGTNDSTRAAHGRARAVPIEEFGARGADPNRLVFARIADEMRKAYGAGRDNEAFAIATLIPRLADLQAGFWRAPGSDQNDGLVRLNLDTASWKLFDQYRGQEAHTMQLRALERIIEQGAGCTEHEMRRLRQLHAGLASGYAITLLTAEVTLDDVKTVSSIANPRPDLGTPEYGGACWLMGGAECGNTAIFYPGGEVYLGDMPMHGVTRVITPAIAEDEKRHGTYVAGTFMRTGANGVVNPGTQDPPEHRIPLESEFGRAYSSVMEEMTHKVSHEQLYGLHAEMLSRLCEQLGLTQEILEGNADNPRGRLLTGRALMEAYVHEITELAEEDSFLAASLFNFAFSGYGSKDAAEQSVGLENSDAPYDYMMMEWHNDLRWAFCNSKDPAVKAHFEELRDLMRDIGRALTYTKMTRLAEAYPRHPQIQEFIRSIKVPEKTLEQASEDLLAHHHSFNESWLR